MGLHTCTTNDNAHGPDDAVWKVLEDLRGPLSENQVKDHSAAPNRQTSAQVISQGNQVTNTTDGHQPTETVVDRRSLPSLATENCPQVEPPPPSFSFGVTQEERPAGIVQATPIGFVLPQQAVHEDVVQLRKSKRARNVLVVLQIFKCNPIIAATYTVSPDIEQKLIELVNYLNNRGSIDIGMGVCVSSREFDDIALRTHQMSPKVMDALMRYVNSLVCTQVKACEVFDTTLPAALMRQHSRFVKTAVKDRHKIKHTDEVMSRLRASTADRVYFPFNMD